ncbi:DNA-binding PadR family transcriptional regulator [Psychromicrobium silvestre]|uniref:DNA-binding PadR family transcriptional regulator n=1 Tax=Psychromicrobium silvestre TaxID=1645614 RepID=A0A7Y9LR86_9MICC|nr:PadR family transcriptional regulator [Psychromicrobium silvestre]NYE94125.1 DNA-binding PadR family transcriptional regulator [Psychromicrobium silvestre]
MAERCTPLGGAVLALLMERSMHPYEMYQILIERREDRLMKIRPGSLYHAVDRLLAQGLIQAEGTEREGNRPERTTYSILPSGYRALGDSLSVLLREVAEEYPAFRRGVAEAHNLPKQDVLGLLRERESKLQESLEDLESNSAALVARGLERQLWLDVGYDIEMQKAEINWINRTISELEGGDLEWTAHSRFLADNPGLQPEITDNNINFAKEF